MTTARALLRRFLRQRRLASRVSSAEPPPASVDQRLEAARQRLKQSISPPEEADETSQASAIPPPEGVSPDEESPPVP